MTSDILYTVIVIVLFGTCISYFLNKNMILTDDLQWDERKCSPNYLLSLSSKKINNPHEQRRVNHHFAKCMNILKTNNKGSRY